MSEKEIQDQILEWLKLNGYFCWRNNIGRRGVVSYGHKGSTDILGMTKAGTFLGIEVKDAKGIVSEDQLKFIECVNQHGGMAFVARSLGEVIERLKMDTKIKLC